MDPILGQIILWPIAWVPDGWVPCDGRLLPLNQYQALYSLLGTRFGGDGVTTFGVPDLRSKFPIGAQNVTQVGQTGGAATADLSGVTGAGAVTIGLNNLPSHTHAATFTPGVATTASVAVPADDNGNGTENVPGTNKVLATLSAGAIQAKVYTTDAPNTTLKPFDVSVPASTGTVEVQSTGNGQALPVSVRLTGAPVNTVPPYNTLNFIMAVQGIYPSRP